MEKLLDLHKKMYDVRWNGSEGDPEELEKEFMAMAKLEGVDLEETNVMLNMLYIPPYKEEMLPEYLKSNNHGGKREGAGRPSLGITKKVSITLPDTVWADLEEKKGKQSMSAYLREILMPKRVFVFYKLQDDRYKIELEGKIMFVGKKKWNDYIDQQHNRKNGEVSLSGSVGIELDELDELIIK
ncbi:hypothetical protein DL988_22270 [Shigella flexneri]|nr:hypothetical protein [Shigella flexneri]